MDSGVRLWAAKVHAAHLADGPASLSLVRDILYIGDRLRKVYGIQAYNGVFATALGEWDVAFEKTTRPESALGFVTVAKVGLWNERLCGPTFFVGQ
ncbi:hypothetical protein [Spirosoma daeguense]